MVSNSIALLLRCWFWHGRIVSHKNLSTSYLQGIEPGDSFQRMAEFSKKKEIVLTNSINILCVEIVNDAALSVISERAALLKKRWPWS